MYLPTAVSDTVRRPCDGKIRQLAADSGFVYNLQALFIDHCKPEIGARCGMEPYILTDLYAPATCSLTCYIVISRTALLFDFTC